MNDTKPNEPRKRAKKTPNAQRRTPNVERVNSPRVELKPRVVSQHFIYRRYWNAEETHCPYIDKIHDLKDHPLFQLHNLTRLFSAIAVEDGEEVEISVRRTGRRPFGKRIWKLIAPHQYGPIEGGLR